MLYIMLSAAASTAAKLSHKITLVIINSWINASLWPEKNQSCYQLQKPHNLMVRISYQLYNDLEVILDYVIGGDCGQNNSIFLPFPPCIRISERYFIPFYWWPEYQRVSRIIPCCLQHQLPNILKRLYINHYHKLLWIDGNLLRGQYLLSAVTFAKVV